MLVAIIGGLGSGKTLVLTWYGYKMYSLGYKIYANYPIHFNHIPVEEPSKIEDLREGIFLGDELWSWMDSRTSLKEATRISSALLLRSRHRKFDVIYTTQHFSQMDYRVRNITDEFWLPEYHEHKKICVLRIFDRSGTYLEGYKIYAPLVFPLYDSWGDLYEPKKPRFMEIIDLAHKDKTLQRLKKKVAKITWIRKKYKVTREEAITILEVLETEYK